MRALPSFFPSVIRGATRDAVRGYALGAALLHLATVAHHAYRGVSIRHDFGPSSASGTWDWFWQNLVTADLRDRALQSLWHLHAQPPLWNALNAPLIKLFGESHPEALFVLHALMGAAMAAVAVWATARLTGSALAAIVAGVLVALDPALVLYEAYALYDLLCAFLVMVAFWAMVRAGPDGRTAPLVSALAAVTALVLTRSVYHVALLVPVVIGAAVLARRRTLVLAAGVALALLPAGWYAKNLVDYGFSGGSSWYGMGIWRAAMFRVPPQEATRLLRAGALDPVVTVPPLSPPSRYRALGYVGSSDVPSLSRDDLHNVNVPAISRGYARSARSVILDDPLHFLGNVAIGYGNFSAPSTEFDHLAPDRDRMGIHVTVWRVAMGLRLVRILDRRLPIGTVGSLFTLLIPTGLVAHALLIRRRLARRDPRERVLREEAPLLAAALLVFYTAVVGSALELGENVRFKFMIEPLLLTIWTVLAVRGWREWRSSGRDAPQGAHGKPHGGSRGSAGVPQPMARPLQAHGTPARVRP